MGGLKMRDYTIDIIVVNPVVDVVTWGAPPYEGKRVTIKGYTLKDAKRRAGIE